MKKLGKIFLILNISFLNLAVFYLIFLVFSIGRKENKDLISPPVSSRFNLEDINLSCQEPCKDYIEEEIKQLLATTESKLTYQPTNTPEPTSTKTQKKASYFPIPGSGSTVSTDWTSVPGTDFYLSKTDFPNLVGVFLEVNMRLLNGNGEAYVRLFDKTHGIAVVGSELKTSNQSSTFVSGGPLQLWDGFNNYAIQIKSLTADTAIFESGRLKIITEE